MAKLLLHLRLRHPDHFLGSIVPKYNAVSRAFSQRWGGQRWDDAVFAQVDKEETYVPGGGAPRHCYTGFRVPPLAAPVDPGRLVCQMGGLAEQFRELAGLGGAAEP